MDIAKEKKHEWTWGKKFPQAKNEIEKPEYYLMQLGLQILMRKN